MIQKYWISVVSKAHIQKGIAWGIAQVCHGKAGPLKRMKAGDWMINYSSVISLEKKEKLQKFTAIGNVKTGYVYQVDMGENFKPFRLDMNYIPCKEVSIHPLIEALSFIKNPRQWGYPFRFGHFEISKSDFECIAKEMEVQINQETLDEIGTAAKYSQAFLSIKCGCCKISSENFSQNRSSSTILAEKKGILQQSSYSTDS